MKTTLLLLLSTFSSAIFAQQVIHITPQQLMDNIRKTEGKSTVIQFWNPNCKEVSEIVTEYKAAEEGYSKTTDFYFIAITSKDELIVKAIAENNYKYNLYVVDASVQPDLYERRQTFCKQLSKLLKIKEADFLSLCLDKNDKVTYTGDAAYSDIKKVIPTK
ncbi:hypothetical protein FMM05_10970 [Flavobacterium zepuense]|uniref:Thioredoxin domain-containing protein n=1 Tax=Flavobacterium zepuense TaxID=2593302 RepID=A0A552V1L8_9FLAO|nr:hypothetical protein [Flavobacterium zepuense]TRW24345.1 hypothetical protein FMM05_10970 [Flavobacterium zepuense]